jgi:hypothetical protein
MVCIVCKQDVAPDDALAIQPDGRCICMLCAYGPQRMPGSLERVLAEVLGA